MKTESFLKNSENAPSDPLECKKSSNELQQPADNTNKRKLEEDDDNDDKTSMKRVKCDIDDKENVMLLNGDKSFSPSPMNDLSVKSDEEELKSEVSKAEIMVADKINSLMPFDDPKEKIRVSKSVSYIFI